MSKTPSHKETGNADVLAKLQWHSGYQGWRIRLYPHNPALWLAETYTYIGKGNTKGWRALLDKKDNYRTFATPELAHEALISLQKELDRLENQYS